MNMKADLTSEPDIIDASFQNGRVAGDIESSIAKEMLVEVPEARSINALLLIQQYTALRSEIEKRIDIRQQILALTLLVAGTFLTVGAQPTVSAVVLLFYPIIAMFLGAIWEHNDLRVGQINFYIRTEVEKHLGSLGPGWETFRQQVFSTSYKDREYSRRSTNQRHPLTPQIGLIVFATRGMFFTTQATTIIVAAVRYLSEFLQHGFAIHLTEPKQIVLIIAIGLLFLGDIGILIYTFSIVQHKRG